MKKVFDANGVEWAEWDDYKMAAVNGSIVVAPVEGVTAQEARESFLNDLAALIEAGMLRVVPGEEQNEEAD